MVFEQDFSGNGVLKWCRDRQSRWFSYDYSYDNRWGKDGDMHCHGICRDGIRHRRQPEQNILVNDCWRGGDFDGNHYAIRCHGQVRYLVLELYFSRDGVFLRCRYGESRRNSNDNSHDQ